MLSLIMAQVLVRNIDDDRLKRLRARAKAQKTSVEALAREAIHSAADELVTERKSLVQEMQEWSRNARVPGGGQSLGVDLIREARDHDH